MDEIDSAVSSHAIPSESVLAPAVSESHFTLLTMPEPIETQSVSSEPSSPKRVKKELRGEMIAEVSYGSAGEPKELVDYYSEASRWLHEGVFASEYSYSYEFMKCFKGEDVEDLDWRSLLADAIDEASVDEHRRKCLQYREERAGATFIFHFIGYSGVASWRFRISVTDGEEPSSVITKFLQRFEYVAGMKFDMKRLLFADLKENPLTKEDEIVSQAIKKCVLVGIVPRGGHPHSDPWCFEDVVPTIMMYVYRNNGCFPLRTRFRIWTLIWGTAQTITKLIKANPNFLERAQSVGVNENVFNDVLSFPIPSIPAIEPIPLEVLESTTLLRGMIGYMYDNGLIDDDAGLHLKMR